MEQITQENSKTIKQLNICADAVALNQRIDKIKDNPLLHKIIEGIEEADELIKATNKLMKHDLSNVLKEYNQVMRDLRETQTDIVKYLVKLKKQRLTEEECPKTPHQKLAFILSHEKSNSNLLESSKNPIRKSALKQVQLKFNDLAVTPKISIKDYKESPLVRKVKANVIPFDLLDFDVHVTREQFESIPKYMRGRTSCDELQYFLEHTIIACFNEKYKLLHRTRAAVQHTKEFELWKVYHSQISYVPGRNFITAGDISRKMQKMIDRKTQNFLVMIRHLGIMQEQRISQTICYIWKTTAE